jgi:hypothetical protein
MEVRERRGLNEKEVSVMELNRTERLRHSRRQSLNAILSEDVHERESSAFS